MFTGGTIWISTHGHVGHPSVFLSHSRDELLEFPGLGASQVAAADPTGLDSELIAPWADPRGGRADGPMGWDLGGLEGDFAFVCSPEEGSR